MGKKIVLVGAGSTSFGPSMFNDLYLSKELEGSTVVLHDINKEKLEMIYELLLAENERKNNKFNLEMTLSRKEAFENADFIISSIEIGDRMKLWRQDYEIPRKHGSTQILGECGGPGGAFHAWRIIPTIVEIVKDAEKICPDAFFINFSNPLSRVCLAIKRTVHKLKFIGLCHQIGFMTYHLPIILNKTIKELRLKVGGLNHFTFLLGVEDLSAQKSLMSKVNKKILSYFEEKEDRFEFSSLSFEIFKRFGYFSYAGDNHIGEYLQFGEEFTNSKDMVDWIDLNDKTGKKIYARFVRNYNLLKKGKYPKKGSLWDRRSGERAIPIIEAITNDKNSYEYAVNISNDNIVENLPQDLILECSATVNKEGVHGVKLGNLPRNIAAILRIEATVQDLCVEAVLTRSKDLAIASLAIDPNVGSLEMAENMFNEMIELQRGHLPKFR
ncbi:MAG: family 4 glycosyl hydrolase [Promethearchaeota archaeon]|jgi:alpha-galactosidase